MFVLLLMLRALHSIPLLTCIYHLKGPAHLTIQKEKNSFIFSPLFAVACFLFLFFFFVCLFWCQKKEKKRLKTHLCSAGKLILVAPAAERSLPSKRLTVLKQTAIDSSVLRIQLSHHLFTQWFRKWPPFSNPSLFFLFLPQCQPGWTPSCVS